jgi:hypothetical protein
MDENQNQKEINELNEFIASAERSLESAKVALRKLTGENFSSNTPSGHTDGSIYSSVENGTIVEGIFNGENMIGPDDKIFPIPANYASKSKLIEGDKLKLTIAEDGSFIFKQIGPAQRKKIIGTLAFTDNVYHVLAEGKSYNVLYASVTYFKAKPDDRVTLIVPADHESMWGALDNVIQNIPDTNGIVMKKPELNEEQTYGEAANDFGVSKEAPTNPSQIDDLEI